MKSNLRHLLASISAIGLTVLGFLAGYGYIFVPVVLSAEIGRLNSLSAGRRSSSNFEAAKQHADQRPVVQIVLFVLLIIVIAKIAQYNNEKKFWSRTLAIGFFGSICAAICGLQLAGDPSDLLKEWRARDGLSSLKQRPSVLVNRVVRKDARES